jgi:hypothetical protein
MATSPRFPGSGPRPSFKRILIAAGLAAAVAAPAWAQEDQAVDLEAALQAGWRDNMATIDTPDVGCFHAAYPELFWEQVECAGSPLARPAPPSVDADTGEVTGNGHDYVAEAKGLITASTGSFATTGVTSEKSVGGKGAILGPNEYSLQINTNLKDTTSACAKHAGCTVWQQFIYATDALGKGKAAVFIQYWLINWGKTACPKTWTQVKPHCVKNSVAALAKDLPITDLGKMVLKATASAGGHDTVTTTFGKDVWAVTTKDSVVDIASVWHESEFNVVGDAGGSRADFNKGAKVTVTLKLADGSKSKPTCAANAGTTGETNNLNLGACTASAPGGVPQIAFSEHD